MSHPSDVPSATLLKKVKRYLTETEAIPRWKLIVFALGLVLMVNIVQELNLFSNSASIDQIDEQSS